MTDSLPTIGRIVHFTNHKGEGPFAAIVVGLNPNEPTHATLFVLPTPTSAVSMEMEVVPDFTAITENHFPTARSWAWPPRD